MVRAALTLHLTPARARGACRRSPSIRYKPVCDNRLDCCWHHELIKKQKREDAVFQLLDDFEFVEEAAKNGRTRRTAAGVGIGGWRR